MSLLSIRRLGAALSAGLSQGLSRGFSGPAVSLAIQAQLPGHGLAASGPQATATGGQP